MKMKMKIDKRWWTLGWTGTIILSPTIAALGSLLVTWMSPFLILGGIIASYYLFRFFAWNVWGEQNLFFTFIGENRAKIVMKGYAFHKVLLQKQDSKVSEKDDPVQEIISGDIVKDPDYKKRSDFVYYGFWPIYDIHTYHFKWKGANGKEGDKIIDYILTKTVQYLFALDRVEDKEGFPLELECLLDVRVINPHLTLFNIPNWLDMTVNHVHKRTRELIGSKAFKTWANNPVKAQKGLYDKIEADQERLFHRTLGVVIENVGILDINPSRHRDILLKESIAKKSRAAILVEADAEAQRIAKVSQAIKDAGESGQVALLMEALKKEGGSNFVLPSKLTNMIESIGGGKKQ